MLALLSLRYKEEKERGEDSDDDAFDATSQGRANAIFLSFFLRANCLLGIENNKDGAFSTALFHRRRKRKKIERERKGREKRERKERERERVSE